MHMPRPSTRPSITLTATFVVALVFSACTDSGPVAPNTEPDPGVRSPSPVNSSAVTANLTIPVTFTIAGGTCGLATTVTGSGVFHIVARSVQTGTGAWHVSFSYNAHGTATGADGSRYVFNYAINARSVNPTGPNDVATLDLVDHFNLIGQGKTPDMKIYFRGRFLYDGVNITPVDAVIRGELLCDPI